MDLINYWKNKLDKYSAEEWSKTPNKFALEVTKYLPKTGSLLDLGAGVCQDSFYFSSIGYQVTATDIVLVHDKNPQFKSVFVDLSNPLPFSSNSFDIVYSHLGMHFFNSDKTKEIFRDIYNILKAGGVFCATFNSTADPEITQSQLIETDYYLTPSGLKKHFFNPTTLAKLLPNEFDILLLDDQGKTIKDKDGSLIRLVCKK